MSFPNGTTRGVSIVAVIVAFLLFVGVLIGVHFNHETLLAVAGICLCAAIGL